MSEDQKKIERFANVVHNRVLMDQIRVINLPIRMKKEYNQLMKDLLEIARYEEKENEGAMTWPILIGKTGSTFGLRVKVSYAFWEHFKREGKNTCLRTTGLKGPRLGLCKRSALSRKIEKIFVCSFAMNAIRRRYEAKGKQPVFMQLRKDQLKIGERGVYDPVILVERLNIDLSEWKGLSMDKLLDEKLLEEKKGSASANNPAKKRMHEDECAVEEGQLTLA
ncbi:unnamed protein product [Nippostrongylus brasiliensis]|uniref:Reverse transcriptase domain-containing protein n=1 Tax=Nippostrongylus brasiliensis TaxID=27835 RepID=A0A0N4XX96_NIPBR|nr:unnamed protein product [Nippostrongylus brasiliensis]